VQVLKLEDRLGSTTNAFTIKDVYLTNLILKYAHLKGSSNNEAEIKKALSKNNQKRMERKQSDQ